MLNAKRAITYSLAGVLLLLVLTVPAQATFINGAYQIGSTSMQVTVNDIIFYTLPGLVPSIGAPNGNFQVLPPVSGDFATRTGQIGTIKNLTRLPANSPPYSLAPADAAVAILDFMTLPAAPAMTFELTNIASGGTQAPGTPLCTAANFNLPGTVCVVDPGSPFLLENRRDNTGQIGTYFTLRLNGLGWFTATPTQQSTWVMSVAGSIAGQTIGQTLGQLASTGHVDTSLQGSVVVTPIPEPSVSYLLLSGALTLLVGGIRRRK
jgi:hypothetical protein